MFEGHLQRVFCGDEPNRLALLLSDPRRVLQPRRRIRDLGPDDREARRQPAQDRLGGLTPSSSKPASRTAHTRGLNRNCHRFVFHPPPANERLWRTANNGRNEQERGDPPHSCRGEWPDSTYDNDNDTKMHATESTTVWNWGSQGSAGPQGESRSVGVEVLRGPGPLGPVRCRPHPYPDCPRLVTRLRATAMTNVPKA